MSVRSIEAEVSIKSGVQAECSIGREVMVEVYEEAVLEPLTVTENGSYAPAEGVDGYSDVTVAVPERVPDIEGLTVTANGTYTAEGDGYNPVTVSVPERIPVTVPLLATQNGTYEPIEGVDGFFTVNVDVPQRVVATTFSAPANGNSIIIDNGYTGNGYPIMVIVMHSIGWGKATGFDIKRSELMGVAFIKERRLLRPTYTANSSDESDKYTLMECYCSAPATSSSEAVFGTRTRYGIPAYQPQQNVPIKIYSASRFQTTNKGALASMSWYRPGSNYVLYVVYSE